ncbi:hypothetical protein PpBr36_01683 [Pyricularia pennisetigena]|uniref:hypothetical protein n=1 Tax=Pyricularia pennisetigena TaxID=1578925 RepID=UPI00114FA744|nr:hypothetical protein PpBr36_01683 [Pyricularia pennisetigena]TLS28170.1 hypothetical protein PpBr36_01683 [Pyricularia pennisetigena]
MPSPSAPRGRGRPRKSDAGVEADSAGAAVDRTPKSRRGPSARAPGEADAKVTKSGGTGRRGRPPKDANAPPKPPGPKKEPSGRPRGRPRLYAPGESPTALKIAAKRAAAKKDGRGRPRKNGGLSEVKKADNGEGEDEEDDEDADADANGENEDDIDEEALKEAIDSLLDDNY